MEGLLFTLWSKIKGSTQTFNCVIFTCIVSGDEPNGEPSTSRADVHDETDFSMASLAKREITQVCNQVNWLIIIVIRKYKMLIRFPVYPGWHS